MGAAQQHNDDTRLTCQWLEGFEERVCQRIQTARCHLTPTLLERSPSLTKEFCPASGEVTADVQRVTEGCGAEEDPREGDERESCQRGERGSETRPARKSKQGGEAGARIRSTRRGRSKSRVARPR